MWNTLTIMWNHFIHTHIISHNHNIVYGSSYVFIQFISRHHISLSLIKCDFFTFVHNNIIMFKLKYFTLNTEILNTELQRIALLKLLSSTSVYIHSKFIIGNSIHSHKIYTKRYVHNSSVHDIIIKSFRQVYRTSRTIRFKILCITEKALFWLFTLYQFTQIPCFTIR